MSSRYVRTTVRNWLNQGSVPFYDSVNFEINPDDEIWCTVDWTFSNRTIDTYCGDALEDGTFSVVFFCTGGIGDDALLQAAETAIQEFMSRTDTSGRLVLLDYDPPNDYRDGDKFSVEVLVSYEYRA